MSRSDPLDHAAIRPDGADLPARLALAGVGLALCALCAAQGLPGNAAVAATPEHRSAPGQAPHGLESRAVAPRAEAPRLVRTVADASAAPPAGVAPDPSDPFAPLRHVGLGAPIAPLADFDDLPFRGTVRTSEAAASAPATASPERAEAKSGAFVVMIDPGHGGTDPGSIAPNGLTEKALTADIAARARRFLSEIEGIEVRLTREGDVGLSRQDRVDRIRAAGADLVVSLHFNHLPQTDVTLVESYYAAAENIEESRRIRAEAEGDALVRTTAPDLSFTEGSARLASLVQRRVFGEVAHGNADATDAGVKRETLFVLTRSFVAGALVELTCISNPGEAERLESEDYRDRLAAALADAVRDYRASLAERPLGALDT